MKSFLYITFFLLYLSYSYSWWIFSTDYSRKYYIGGSFDKINTTSGQTIEANNIAYYDKGWNTIGKGTDGPVHDIRMDACRNIYVAGAFNNIDGYETGPIAVRKAGYDTWKAVGNAKFTNDSYVNAIDLDCWNPFWDVGFNFDCYCDVYIGGKFEMTNTKAINVAKYDANSGEWNGCARSTGSFYFDKEKDEVFALYKRGLPSLSTKKELLIGYDKGLVTYNINDQQYGNFADTKGPVKTIQYESSLLGNDVVIIGGDFNVTCSDPQYNCAYFARIKSYSNLERILKNDEEINGAVNSVKYIDQNFFLGGEFYRTGEFKNLAKVKSNHPDQLIRISEFNSYNSIPGKVVDIAVCATTDVGCTSGSVFLVDDKGTAQFYDMGTDNWEVWGIVNGNLKSAAFFYASSRKASLSFGLLIISSLIYIFMF